MQTIHKNDSGRGWTLHMLEESENRGANRYYGDRWGLWSFQLDVGKHRLLELNNIGTKQDQKQKSTREIEVSEAWRLVLIKEKSQGLRCFE